MRLADTYSSTLPPSFPSCCAGRRRHVGRCVGDSLRCTSPGLASAPHVDFRRRSWQGFFPPHYIAMAIFYCVCSRELRLREQSFCTPTKNEVYGTFKNWNGRRQNSSASPSVTDSGRRFGRGGACVEAMCANPETSREATNSMLDARIMIVSTDLVLGSTLRLIAATCYRFLRLVCEVFAIGYAC